MSGDAAWPEGEAEAVHDVVPTPVNRSFPLIWCLVVGAIYASLDYLRDGWPTGSSAESVGYVIGTVVGPVLISGIVWLFVRRRSVAIGVAAFVLLAPIISTLSSNFRVKRAVSDYQQLILKRSGEYERLFELDPRSGEFDSETLTSDAEARKRLRLHDEICQQVVAIVDELRVGDDFGKDLRAKVRAQAWEGLRESKWYRDSFAMMDAQARYFTAVRDYIKPLSDHYGNWAVNEEGTVEFDESVPDAVIDAMNAASELINSGSEEIASLADELGLGGG